MDALTRLRQAGLNYLDGPDTADTRKKLREEVRGILDRENVPPLQAALYGIVSSLHIDASGERKAAYEEAKDYAKEALIAIHWANRREIEWEDEEEKRDPRG